MTRSLPLIQVTARHRRMIVAVHVAVFLASIIGLLKLGATPLNGIFLVLVPCCFLATLRGASDAVILTVMTLGASVGVLLNVEMGLRGPGVLSWIILAPVAAALCHLQRSSLGIFAIVVGTWIWLATTLPASFPTPWSELRTHYLLILIASAGIAWVNTRQLTRWHDDAHRIIGSFRQMIDLHPLPAIVLLDGKIDILNEQACLLLQTDRDLLVGKPIEAVLPIELGPPGDLTLVKLEIRGSVHTVEIRHSQVAVPRGHGAILVLTDRTEALSQQLEEQKQAIQRKDAERLELIGRIAGGVAHDFNNVLTTILVNVDLAETTLDRDGKALCLQSHAEIRAAAEFAGDLVAQLLAYSGRGPVLREVVDVAARMSAMIDLLQGLAREAKVELSFAADHSFSIESDPTHLSQVLVNLVTNAIEASEEGGQVRVSIHRTQLDAPLVEGMVRSPLFKKGSFLEIRVEDDGAGIAPEQIDRMFEPYFSTRESGSGLGLAAVRGIIDANGGALASSSGLGLGTLFRAFLPLRNLDPGPRASSSENQKGKILIVDDDPSVLSLVCSAMQRANFATVTASTLDEARVVLASDETIVLVLSDYGLPDGTGLDLRDNARGGGISVPLVLMSSYRIQDLADLGGIRLLSKPFDFDQVAEALEEELERTTQLYVCESIA